MLLHLLPVAGLILVSVSATLEIVDLPSLDEDLGEEIVLQTKAIDEKLSQLETRLKHLLKRNNSRSDVDKLTKYIFVTIMGIKLDLSKLVQNHSTKSNRNVERMSHPRTESTVKKTFNKGYNVFKMCRHIIESDVCQKMEENQEQHEMTKLLRVADKLINIKTRFRIYSAIYEDMVQKRYDNILNLNKFVNMLVYHFISNSNTPSDVTQEAKYLLKSVGETFKGSVLQEVTEHILNNCTSDMDAALWQLTTTVGAFEQFNGVLEAAINASYDSVGAIALLDRSLWGRTTQGACQTVRNVHAHVKSDGDLYHTETVFKLIRLIAHALNNSYATLDELEPCLQVEDQLNPSAREIIYARGGCLQNQLHKSLMFTVRDEQTQNKNRTVFVSTNHDDREYARWNFEADGFNRFWIRHHQTREYLYASFQGGNSTEVFTLRNKPSKNRWSFQLIPENGGLRILDQEQRYLYVTPRVLEGDSKKHLVAVWQGEGIPSGSVWTVLPC